MKQARKIKVIGFPFAKSQVGIGAASTPSWLTKQQWFTNMMKSPKIAGVEYEVVPVNQIERFSKQDVTDPKLQKHEINTILVNCQRLMRHIQQAL
jgi:arginase family enzyme